jgi:hypothetical protein
MPEAARPIPVKRNDGGSTFPQAEGFRSKAEEKREGFAPNYELALE